MRLKSKKYVDNIDFAYDIEVKDNHNYTTNNIYTICLTICINIYIDKATVYTTSAINAQNARLTTILLVTIELILRLRWKNVKFRSDAYITACIHA